MSNPFGNFANEEKSVRQTSTSNADYVKLETGENRLRILPGSFGELGRPFVEYDRHYLNGKYYSYAGDKSLNPIEQKGWSIFNDLKAEGKEKTDLGKKMFKKFLPQIVCTANVINRADAVPVPKKLTISRALMQKIAKVAKDAGDITDPVEGRDVIIERTGTGLHTEYDVRVAIEPSPLSDDKEMSETLLGQIEDLDDWLRKTTSTPEELKQVADITEA